MLAKKYTISKDADFERIKKEGKLFQKDHFGVFILDRKDKDNSRFGFVISRKISKLAIHRNRINRAMHESVRHNLNRIKDGYDVLFLVKKSIADLSIENIMREVRDFLEESKVTRTKKKR